MDADALLDGLGIPAPTRTRRDSRHAHHGAARDTATASGARMTKLSDVTPRPIEWLWPQRFALGKLSLIAGDPGLGKSFVTLDMAAHVSTGSPWPDRPREPNPAGGVVIVSCEDDLADTIHPRLHAAGADLERIVSLDGTQSIDAETGELHASGFCLPRDIGALDEAIERTADCRLVIIDPLSAYFDGIDSHKNADVRHVLAQLAELAACRRVSMVGVAHLNKANNTTAVYRLTGSLAFVAAARSVMLAARDRDDPSGQRRLLLPVKNNLGDDRTGLAYSVSVQWAGAGDIPSVAWEAEPVIQTADEALAPMVPARASARDDAAAWLADQLRDGPRPANELFDAASREGVSGSTLRRAKDSLGVFAEKQGFDAGGHWRWRLPDPPAD